MDLTGDAGGAGHDVLVRVAGESDLDSMTELFVAVAAERRWIGAEPPVDRERRRRYWVEAMAAEQMLVLVAVADEQVVGQLGMDLARYGVADLGMLVLSQFRGRGIGRSLLAEAIGWARDAGAHKVALQVWPHNEAAIALYEKAGFSREGLLRRHYRRRNGELWDAVVMGLHL